VLQAEFSAVISGMKSAEQALPQAQRAVDAILGHAR
jgi:hypothetical protein